MQLITDFTDWLALQPTNYLLLLAIAGLLLLTFGILLGYLIQRGKTKQALRKLTAAEREKADLQHKLDKSDEEQKTLARQLVSMTSEKDETLVRLRDVGKNLEKINAELRRLQTTNEQISATNQSYATTIEDLNDQVIGLKTRNEQLLHGHESNTRATGAGAPSSAVSSLPTDLERRLAVLERRLDELTVADTDPPVNLGEPRHRIRIGEPAAELPGERDDLTKIRSIGPFNERQLHAAGISTYRQIANWSDDDLETYAARIGYVAAIMREEDWIGQAADLANEANTTRAAVIVPDDRELDPEDLTVVEGISPALQATLKDAGVRDLHILAKTPTDELQAMLEQAGQGHVGHRAITWPEQAALAVAGEWERLQTLQEELKAGRPV